MPELPEVETTRRGIEPHVAGRTLTAVTVREPRLRWPVDARVAELRDKRIVGLRRRAKYLLMDLGDLNLGIHLGMSGTLDHLRSKTQAGTLEAPPSRLALERHAQRVNGLLRAELSAAIWSATLAADAELTRLCRSLYPAWQQHRRARGAA